MLAPLPRTAVMNPSTSLESRLAALSHTHKQTIPLINRLQNTSPTSVGQGDEARLELGAEIHARLKDMEEEMEILRVEVDGLEGFGGRKRGNGERDAEREKVVVVAGRLEEDLKSARSQFRKAQLQAKRNADIAKRKERELLLSSARDGDGGRRKTQEKFTQGDLAVNASSDVTSALRRTHDLMQSELSRSQFAQETLEQSTAALSSLSESYSNLDTLLSSSRTLVSSLLRSQKSDTWYLETSLYILLATIAWLVFSRILYGPLWWIVWFPIKMAYRVTIGILSAVGLSGAAVQSSSAVGTSSQSVDYRTASDPVSTVLPVDVPQQDKDSDQDSSGPDYDSMVEQIGKMAEESNQPAQDQGTNVDDISPEEREAQEARPRNTKKRMYEVDVEMEKQRQAEANKDEL